MNTGKLNAYLLCVRCVERKPRFDTLLAYWSTNYLVI